MKFLNALRRKRVDSYRVPPKSARDLVAYAVFDAQDAGYPDEDIEAALRWALENLQEQEEQ